MTATLEIRFDRLDERRLGAVSAVCEAVAPGAWVVEEQRPGFWTAHTRPAAGTFAVTVYLADDPEGALRRAAIERGLADRADTAGVVAEVVRRAAGPDWGEAWKAAHAPVDIGGRIRVAPDWDETPAPAGRFVIRLVPGQAFGLGTHPTTRLALELLETEIRPGDRVADVGCGTGILAIAALGLGAASAEACDIDAACVAATRDAAGRNGVADRLEVWEGGPDSLTGRFDRVVVNVVAEVLRGLLEVLVTRVGADGRLIVSGMRRGQAGEIGERLTRLGLTPGRRREAGGFVAFVASHAGGGYATTARGE